MQITYTEAAQTEISKVIGEHQAELKLVFDAEGCGCSVSGVPTLWVVNERHPEDLTADSEPRDTLYEKKHEVFFDDLMNIDWNPAKRAFSLTSSGQIFNNMMSLIDKRT
ncbi:hypothetical protein SY83_18125 [Paenibacillus swuensis]|uniref:Core domain-containing protein n=1 Tax=Paenibacillus swuensis TaxID=1178515 RepID=A0A172TM88_9BACL|nr:iron-sulfur cluster biosynthesis family protein [Paenibacillus swuensis]ANE47893.1 hypothetical protein SY83_18125 [Paenibacillus swuensis]